MEMLRLKKAESAREAEVAQAFSTLGGSDTDAIKNEKLKEFVNSFGLDMQDLLAAADDGDGSLDLGENACHNAKNAVLDLSTSMHVLTCAPAYNAKYTSGEFKEMLLEKPTQDWLPDKKFQPRSITRSHIQTWASQDPNASNRYR